MNKKTYCNRHKRKKKFEKIINICIFAKLIESTLYTD